MRHRPYNIAHRGLSSRYPENTLVAFRHAVALGVDWVELDVVTTRDGVVVVSHDASVDRCTDGHGRIGEMSLEQVRDCDAGVRFGEQFAGERIPTLEAVIDLVRGSPARLCIEIKGETTARHLQTAQAMVDVLHRCAYVREAVITSYSPECLCAVKEWEPLLATALDPDKQDGTYSPWELCQQVLRCGANFMLHDYRALTAGIVDEAHQHGFSLWTWTVNHSADMRHVTTMGVDGIMTNYSDVLKTVQDEMGGNTNA